MKVVQAMNALDPSDAVTLHLLEIDRMLRAAGHETAIYSQHAHPALASRRAPAKELRSARGDLLLFHYAGYSDLLDSVARFQGRRAVVYHNVTPARFFEGMPQTRAFCEKGRAQLERLPGVFEAALGVSHYNCEDLESIGFREAQVLPISADVSGLSLIEPASEVRRRFADGASNVLVVGRLAPHKGALEAVRAFAEFRRTTTTPTRLLVVGRMRGYEPYAESVCREIRNLGLEGAVEIAGEVSPPELRAYYGCASVLLILSEHEGFCVPALEAMLFGVPVIAYSAAAVPETLGGAGHLLPSREPRLVAEAIERVVTDAEVRGRILAAQRARVAAFSRDAVAARLAEVLEGIVGRETRATRIERPPSFSVVVCTYNRAATLGPCLAALRRLDYPDYEVVVVNGPSTDATESVLARYPDVKRVDNPTRNLSISRNLGITAAAGEIIAFIDDDAVPDVDWLERLAQAYGDPKVGGAGGKVYGPGGDHLQFNNGIISRYGMPIAIQDSPDDRNAPGADWYNILMGTNSSFRRAALEAVGGFDENYEYYHDESDLCVRIIQAGYRIAHVPEACVWHEFERSRIRKALRDVNWRVVAKNTIYFYFMNNRWRARPLDWVQPMRASLVHLGIFTRWFLRGEIGPGLFARALLRWGTGSALGYAKGMLRAPRRHLGRRTDPRSKTLVRFGSAPPRRPGGRLHIALVSQQYRPDACGGIGVYTETLARGLVEAGHRVSVIARGPRESIVWRDGVKIHRVVDERVRTGAIPASYRVVRKNLGRSLAVHHVVDRLVEKEGVRVVEAPLWDAEALATSIERRLPLVIRLNTPMAIAMETQGWRATDDLRLACEMEWAMLRAASGWIDSSGTICKMLATRFGVEPGTIPVREIPFGIALPDSSPQLKTGEARTENAVRILFVGRLEPRKGIDTLLRAIPRVLSECPGANFLVAGEAANGDDPAGEFFRRCGVTGARERVRFLGCVEDATLEDLFASSDIFVAPSRYESFGLVYLEAMAHGKPVVACRAGGASSVVVDSETGLLVPPEDAGALADALTRLAGDASLRARLGAAARLRVQERYSIGDMVQRTVEFYEELLGHEHALTVPATSGRADATEHFSADTLPPS